MICFLVICPFSLFHSPPLLSDLSPSEPDETCPHHQTLAALQYLRSFTCSTILIRKESKIFRGLRFLDPCKRFHSLTTPRQTDSDALLYGPFDTIFRLSCPSLRPHIFVILKFQQTYQKGRRRQFGSPFPNFGGKCSPFTTKDLCDVIRGDTDGKCAFNHNAE